MKVSAEIQVSWSKVGCSTFQVRYYLGTDDYDFYFSLHSSQDSPGSLKTMNKQQTTISYCFYWLEQKLYLESFECKRLIHRGVLTLELQISSKCGGSLWGHKRGMNRFSAPIPHRSVKQVMETFLFIYLPWFNSLGWASLDGDLQQSKPGLYSYCSAR